MANSSRTGEAETTQPDSGRETNFGYRRVRLDEKQGMVNDVFHQVARRYDLMNDLMSCGLHRLWKDAAVSWLSPPKKGNSKWHALDVAGGTGDVAVRILDRMQGAGAVTVCDINESMLRVGQERALETPFAEKLRFALGNAEDLPFASKRFDAYTVAFGIRNVPRIGKALREAHRVLKRGGRFLCLEFSEVDVPVLDKVYDLYSFNVIPWIGQTVAGDGEAYRYLVESIRKFPNQEKLANMIGEAGFARVSYRNFSGGVAAVHSGWKL